jgi:PII-like signaling protein
VTGYTLIRDVAGMGHHGFHEGRLLFNDQASLVMTMAVAPEDTIREVASGLKPLLEKHSGVMFVTDTQVLRLEHFLRKEEAEADA